MKNKSLICTMYLLAVCIFLEAQTVSIFELNKKLGKGVNMGNMFEAPSETAWGNPFRDDYFKRIADLGFNHVRIPIRWDVPERALQSSPFTINKTFLDRIKYVVDKAHAEGLYTIINMHHHDALFQDPDGQKSKFLSQWAQIADYFKGYDQKLLFEVMNEPNTNLTPPKWNVFFKDALAEIRKTNPIRAVLMGTAPWGGLAGVPDMDVPNDDNIILTVHYYDPFTFTHQGAEWVNGSNPWLGTKWENTSLERNEIISAFDFLQTFAKQKNKPIYVGEFGAYSKADLESRIKWTNFLARWFESQGFSWAYWEWSAGFGIFNPGSNQVLTSLSDALIKNPMLPARQQSTRLVYQSDFNNNEGWFLGVQPSASASFIRLNGEGIVDITRASTEGWHAQLTKANIKVKKDSRYQVTIKASATVPVSITNYIGRNSSPWDSYSGYKSLSITTDLKEHIYSFNMTSPTDTLARIAFDVGTKVSKITIASVKIEEVFDSPVSIQVINDTKLKVFPNPTSDFVRILNIENIKSSTIYNSLGQVVKIVKAPKNEIFIGNLETGWYTLAIENPDGIRIRKILKQ